MQNYWRIKFRLLSVFLASMLGACSTPGLIIDQSIYTKVNQRLQADWYEPYRPHEQNSYPWNLFSKSVFPNDFIDGYEESISLKERPLVVWTGIIIERDVKVVEGGEIESFIVEHRFWDWSSTSDDHLIFISNKGESKFRCGISDQENGPGHKLGQFVIVYGFPFTYEEESNVVNMECMNTRFLNPEYFTADVWSYGRRYVLEGDISDITILDYEIE